MAGDTLGDRPPQILDILGWTPAPVSATAPTPAPDHVVTAPDATAVASHALAAISGEMNQMMQTNHNMSNFSGTWLFDL